MTKDTAEFSQCHAVACRVYILPSEEEASQPNGWIQWNTKIGPVLEVATCCLHGKYGVDIRIMSLNRDNTHSWVRISHGSTKFVMNLNNNDTEIPEDQLENHALQLDATDFVCRKAKSKKTTKKGTYWLFTKQEQFLLGRELGLMLNQGNIPSPSMRCRSNSSSSPFTTCGSRRR